MLLYLDLWKVIDWKSLKPRLKIYYIIFHGKEIDVKFVRYTILLLALNLNDSETPSSDEIRWLGGIHKQINYITKIIHKYNLSL